MAGRVVRFRLITDLYPAAPSHSCQAFDQFCLNKAISERQIELYLQPIVDIETRNVVGSEALLRWNHPLKGAFLLKYLFHCREVDLIDDLTATPFNR